MAYTDLTDAHIAELTDIVGTDCAFRTDEERDNFSHDYTEDLRYLPDIVLKPQNTEQISRIMRYCNENHIPVTPAGARTGLSGGALPVEGGVSLSTEKLNRIIEIDTRNFIATVEPGVINQVFYEAVIEQGLFYPPDPASRGSCTMGGNLAENSGGPKAVKYGTTKDYVLNLEVVLPSGEVINTGANVFKNATGYNLTQLIVGSEGTLGIITKMVLRLIPYPAENLLMLAPFRSADQACKAVNGIMLSGMTPSGLEFMERDALIIARDYLKTDFDIPDDIQAHLLVEVDGNDIERLQKDCERIAEVLDEYEAADILFADTKAAKDQLWQMRRIVGEATHAYSTYKEEDTVVPRAELPVLLKGVKDIGARYGFRSVCYGHAGDGNLHVNILKGDMADHDWNRTVKKGIRELFELCKRLGGTISGEHGIGLVQREYMDVIFSETELDLMRGIKRLFDPNNILNPGKII